MALTGNQTTQLCRWAGVLVSDGTALSVLEGCYDRACDWYAKAGCDLTDPAIQTWLFDLAAWFYDNRGRSDAEIPPFIVKSVHHFRKLSAGGE